MMDAFSCYPILGLSRHLRPCSRDRRYRVSGERGTSVYPLVTHFGELLKNVRPPQERLDAARDWPAEVRSYLKEHSEFETLDPHTRLTGSYAQKMSVGDVKDVDLIVRIPGDIEENDPTPRSALCGLRDVLGDLPGYLGFEGGDIEVKGHRRSVHVYFSGPDFHLDVVPAIVPNGIYKPLYVPDRGWNTWQESDPLGYVRLVQEMNDNSGKKFRPLGVLLKHFRNIQMKTREPKSYWLGALLVYHCRAGNLDFGKSIGELFRDLVDAIYRQYHSVLNLPNGATPNIEDPMVGNILTWNWQRAHFETFMRRLDDARKRADKALGAKTREEAVKMWQRIFGEDYFPTTVGETAQKTASASWPGVAYVTNSGLVTPVRPASGATATRPTTFHGQDD